MSTKGINLTDHEYHELTILYEESTSRPRNSDGAWHVQLIVFVRELGYDVSDYQQALVIAREILEEKECHLH